MIQRIKEAGFKIQIEKEVSLTKELAAQFYHEHEGKEFYDGLTDHMARYIHDATFLMNYFLLHLGYKVFFIKYAIRSTC